MKNWIMLTLLVLGCASGETTSTEQHAVADSGAADEGETAFGDEGYGEPVFVPSADAGHDEADSGSRLADAAADAAGATDAGVDADAADGCQAYVDCGNPETITPYDAPVSFTAVASCGQLVRVVGFRCYKYNGSARYIDKGESCEVSFEGATLTVHDSGGVADTITWTLETGAGAQSTCSVGVSR